MHGFLQEYSFMFNYHILYVRNYFRWRRHIEGKKREAGLRYKRLRITLELQVGVKPYYYVVLGGQTFIG